MVRRIIHINQAACNGCALCAEACHEGAIAMVDGKARLIRDDYCDGLGDCLPACPTGAITFEEREAAAYDEAAVEQHMARRAATGADTAPPHPQHSHAGGCPGSNAHAIHRAADTATPAAAAPPQSRLNQWPVQIRLVPVQAPYFAGAHLLIAADCTAFAYGDFHHRFMKNRVTLIGCPKLDSEDYSEKLTEILRHNEIKSVTVARMEVPCCGGIASAAVTALQSCGKMIPWQVVTLTTDGQILED